MSILNGVKNTTIVGMKNQTIQIRDDRNPSENARDKFSFISPHLMEVPRRGKGDNSCLSPAITNLNNLNDKNGIGNSGTSLIVASTFWLLFGAFKK